MIDEKNLLNTAKMFVNTDVFNVLKQLIEIQPKLDRWIPCSEEMPEETEGFYVPEGLSPGYPEIVRTNISKFVEVTIEYEDGERRVRTSRTVNGKWEIEIATKTFLNTLKVIAWMPLIEIEPYKGR